MRYWLCAAVIAAVSCGARPHHDGSQPLTVARSTTTVPTSVSSPRTASSTSSTSTSVPRTTTSAPTTTTVAPGPVERPQGVDYHSWADWPLWSHIGRCEQPGRGADGINWTHRGTYPGGLGILNVNWLNAARALGLPLDASVASPAQQIEGARYHRLKHGLDGWSCWVSHHREWGL